LRFLLAKPFSRQNPLPRNSGKLIWKERGGDMRKILLFSLCISFFFLGSCEDPTHKEKQTSCSNAEIEKAEKKEVRSRRW
jgi:hypothetical protein